MRMYAFDMETASLAALMGPVLCASFYPVIPHEFHPPKKQKKIKPINLSWTNPKYAGKDILDDKKLVVGIRNFIDDNCDAIVTWNGKLFDIPFLNARLDYHGERIVRPQFHADMMYYARGAGARIGSSKLVNVQKFFELEDHKTEINWNVMAQARQGNKTAMKEIEHHCDMDTIVTEQVYWRLLPHMANLHK